MSGGKFDSDEMFTLDKIPEITFQQKQSTWIYVFKGTWDVIFQVTFHILFLLLS